MTISEVSKKFNLSPDTLRYYEKVGLIPPIRRTAGGLRDYTEEDCGWISHVKCMRESGLSMEALYEYRALSEQGDETIPDRHRLLLEEKQKLLSRIALIEAAIRHLDIKIAHYEEALETGKLNWES